MNLTNIYPVKQEYESFLLMVEQGDIPADAVSDTLESLNCNIDGMIDEICCEYKNAIAVAEQIKAEATALTERKKQKEAYADKLVGVIRQLLDMKGEKKFESARNAVSVKKCPPSLFVADEEKFLEWATKNATDYITVADPKINRTKVLAALKSGEEIDGCAIVADKTTTSIK